MNDSPFCEGLTFLSFDSPPVIGELRGRFRDYTRSIRDGFLDDPEDTFGRHANPAVCELSTLLDRSPLIPWPFSPHEIVPPMGIQKRFHRIIQTQDQRALLRRVWEDSDASTRFERISIAFWKSELAKSNTYYHGIHPVEAAEADAKLAEAAAKKKPASAAATPVTI